MNESVCLHKHIVLFFMDLRFSFLSGEGNCGGQTSPTQRNATSSALVPNVLLLSFLLFIVPIKIHRGHFLNLIIQCANEIFKKLTRQ